MRLPDIEGLPDTPRAGSLHSRWISRPMQCCSVFARQRQARRPCLHALSIMPGPRVGLRGSNPRQQRSVAGGQQDAHSVVHGRGAASTARRWFWREAGQRAGRHRVRRHSGEGNRRATTWTRDDVGLRASRGGSPRAQRLRFDAFEPSSTRGAFRRSRHVSPLACAEHAVPPQLQINWPGPSDTTRAGALGFGGLWGSFSVGLPKHSETSLQLAGKSC